MEGQQIQFISATPEQLKTFIVEGVKQCFRDELMNTSQPIENELMTREEVAKYLKKDVSTIFRMTKKGVLTSYGLGESNSIYYKRSEINETLIKLE